LKPDLKILSKEELDAIYTSALYLLRNVGVNIEDQETRKLLMGNGCDEGPNNIVYFPEWLVKDCLNSTPKEVTICGRDPKKDMTLGRQKYPYIIPHVLNVNYYDAINQNYVTTTRENVQNFVKVCDYLDTVDGIWIVTMLPQFKEMYMFHGFEMGIRSTTKPVCITTLETQSVEPTYELATAIAGGKEELKKRPLMTVCMCAVSPLSWTKQACDTLKALARWGIQPALATEAPMGDTGPVTFAGDIAQKMAEYLSGDVILQLLNKGMAVLWINVHESFDQRTGMVNLASHGDFVQACAMGQIEKHIGVPILSPVSPDSHMLDMQEAYELGFTLLPQMLGGNRAIVVHGLDTTRAFNNELLLLLDDMVVAARRLLDGIEVNPETLAIDVIKNVCSKIEKGRRVGHFLDQRHTLTWYEREQRPRKDFVFEKHSREKWMELGGKTFVQRAHERVEEILKTHKPEPLSKEIEAKIAWIRREYKIGE
jgi:trimethylamine--corrinoid protein Co-methyltransferase